MKTPSVVANNFDISYRWMTPIDIKAGDNIRDVFEKLYIPRAIGDLGIDESTGAETAAKILRDAHESYIQFDMRQDYSISAGIDESGTVKYIRIHKFDYPQYQVAPADEPLEVPAFDRETIATYADLYISGCTLGSSRLDVFKVFGNPQKTKADYGDITGYSQDCYFKNSVVDFFDVTDYEDPETGRASGYFTEDVDLIGPRGLRVGDNVEKILEVFPGRDDIDFKTAIDTTAIYADSDNPDDIINSARIYPSVNKAYTGEVNINIEWASWITFNYADGVITGISLGMMLT
jgi:hypothetical protein